MKKFSKFLSVTLAAAIMTTCFAACSKDDKKSSKETKAETKKETKAETTKDEPVDTVVVETETPETTFEEANYAKDIQYKDGVALAKVSLLSDEELENESNYLMFEYSDSEFAANVKFSFIENVTDFQLVSIEADVDEDGELVIMDVDTEYELSALEDDMSVIIKLDLPEILPTNGIIFTDDEGCAHLLVLLVSGEDGSPYFHEIVAQG